MVENIIDNTIMLRRGFKIDHTTPSLLLEYFLFSSLPVNSLITNRYCLNRPFPLRFITSPVPEHFWHQLRIFCAVCTLSGNKADIYNRYIEKYDIRDAPLRLRFLHTRGFA